MLHRPSNFLLQLWVMKELSWYQLRQATLQGQTKEWQTQGIAAEATKVCASRANWHIHSHQCLSWVNVICYFFISSTTILLNIFVFTLEMTNYIFNLLHAVWYKCFWHMPSKARIWKQFNSICPLPTFFFLPIFVTYRVSTCYQLSQSFLLSL